MPATAVPTSHSTPLATKIIVTASTPGVVQTLPEEYAVEVQVASNGVSVDPKIITTFRGGGINFITQVEVVNARGDGITENAVKNHPNVGDTIRINIIWRRQRPDFCVSDNFQRPEVPDL